MAQETGIIPTREIITTTGSETVNLVQSPYCREIRSKKYYFMQEMPTENHHLMDGSGHCWCSRTMQIVGPDGEMVRAEDCTSERTCYRSLFE